MTKFFADVECTCTREGGEICEGQENEDFPDRENAYYHYDLNGVRFSPYKKELDYNRMSVSTKDRDTIIKQGHAWVVVVTHSDGDTFGSSYGHKQFVKTFVDKEDADALVKAILEDYNKFDDNNDIFSKSKLASIIDNEGFYPYWTGYFSRLESCEAVSLPIIGD